MKKTYLEKTLNALKGNLAKNAVTTEGQALIDEINGILSEMVNDPDVEYNEADILDKVTAAAKTAGAAAAAEVASAFRGTEAKNKVDLKLARGIYEEALNNSQGKGRGAFANEISALCVKNGITGLPSILEIFPEIQTAWKNTSILSKLKKLGKYALTFGISTQSDDDDDVRAGGHIVGNAKVNQTLALTPKTINLGAIYKKIDVPKLTSYQTGNDTALFAWLVQELFDRLNDEVTRAILVGDGRASNSPRKISSFETIGIKTAADAYTVYKNISNAIPTLADIRAMVDDMDDSKPISLYLHPTIKRSVQAYQYAAGGTISYVTDEVLAEQLGVSEIIKYKKLAGAVPAVASTVPCVIAIQHDSYGYVGSDIFSANFEDWNYNTDNLITELFAGGAIIKPLSTGLITVTKP